MILDKMDGTILLDNYVEQSKRIRLEAELDADFAREMARDPKGFNGKFASATRRVQKCPACGGQAVSDDVDEPFACPCGWQSDKTNGATNER